MGIDSQVDIVIQECNQVASDQAFGLASSLASSLASDHMAVLLLGINSQVDIMLPFTVDIMLPFAVGTIVAFTMGTTTAKDMLANNHLGRAITGVDMPFLAFNSLEVSLTFVAAKELR